MSLSEGPEAHPPSSGTESAADGAPLQRSTLGYVFVLACLGLLCFMAYFVLCVVVPMTGTSPVFDELLGQYRDSIKADAQADRGVDKLTVDLIVVLEYASADIRTAGVQIAFSLVSGVFFASVGILLFAAGITGALELSGDHAGIRFNLAKASPGIVCVLLGAGIIVAGVTKDVSRPLEASVRRATGAHYRQNFVNPPAAAIGESTPGESIDEDLPTEDPNGAPPEP